MNLRGNPRILIADDQPSVRSALGLALEQNGASVVGLAANGNEVSDWLAANQVDILLLDWELPGQPMKKLLSNLRSRHPGIFVIVLDSRPQTRTAALSAGADAFVSKGDTLEYLLRAMACCGGKTTPENKQTKK